MTPFVLTPSGSCQIFSTVSAWKWMVGARRWSHAVKQRWPRRCASSTLVIVLRGSSCNRSTNICNSINCNTTNSSSNNVCISSSNKIILLKVVTIIVLIMVIIVMIMMIIVMIILIMIIIRGGVRRVHLAALLHAAPAAFRQMVTTRACANQFLSS